MSDLLSIPGIGPSINTALDAMGIRTRRDLSAANIEDLVKIRGVSAQRAEAFLKAAQETPTAPDDTTPTTADAAPETPVNVVKLVPTPPKAKTKGKDKAKATADAKALKRKKKKARAKLDAAKAKLKKAVKSLEKAKKAAAKDKTKGGGQTKSSKASVASTKATGKANSKA